MKKTYKAIAEVEQKKRTRGMIFSGILMFLCVGALLLSIYSFASENVVFGISYIIAIILGFSYIVIKVNQLFSTYIATDDENIIFRCWDNHFFPYNAWNGIPVIREFIPARSEIITIPMKEINTIIIGTKSYIKRNAENDAFNKEVLPYEKHKYSSITGMLDKANILYISTKSDECCFMSIDGFNPKDTMEVLNHFTSFCDEDVDIKINSRAFKRYLKRSEISKEIKEDSENTEINS